VKLFHHSDTKIENRILRWEVIFKLKEKLLIDLLRQESQLANVCTEPAAIALASAKARSLVKEKPVAIKVVLSPGVMKNSLSVGLPGTHRKGAQVAAALGAMGGSPDMGLQVLRGIKPHQVEEAHDLVDRGKIEVSCDYEQDGIYIMVEMTTKMHSAKVVIQGAHSRFVELALDGAVIPSEEEQKQHVPIKNIRDIRAFAFDELIREALKINYEEVKFLREGALNTLLLGEKCLDGDLLEDVNCISQFMAGDDGDLLKKVRMQVMKLVLARMKGISWPVLTSAGSGNQGIVICGPIIFLSEQIGADLTAQTRALLIANVVNLFVKSFIGKISSLCGAVSAGAGVAAATCWLLGGDVSQIECAVHIVIGSLYGMLCDGAKMSCAIKCAASAVEGVVAGQLASSKRMLLINQGIIKESVEETMKILEKIGKNKISGIDNVIIESFLNKKV